MNEEIWNGAAQCHFWKYINQILFAVHMTRETMQITECPCIPLTDPLLPSTRPPSSQRPSAEYQSDIFTFLHVFAWASRPGPEVPSYNHQYKEHYSFSLTETSDRIKGYKFKVFKKTTGTINFSPHLLVLSRKRSEKGMRRFYVRGLLFLDLIDLIGSLLKIIIPVRCTYIKDMSYGKI